MATPYDPNLEPTSDFLEQPDALQRVVAGRSPTGIGGLTFSDVARTAQQTGGNFMRGLHDPTAQGGALGAGAAVGSLLRKLPGAYQMGRGNEALGATMLANVESQEKAFRMAKALEGLDPTNPEHLGPIAEIAMQFGDTGMALKIMDMIQSGDIQRMKLALQGPKTSTATQGRDIVNYVYAPWHPDADEFGRVEVGRGPKSQTTFNIGDQRMNELDEALYQDVMAETGDPWMAKSAIAGKAFRDPTTQLWAKGDEAEYGKARELEGYIGALRKYLEVVDQMAAMGVTSNYLDEAGKKLMAGLGEGDPMYTRYVQARQELLTQYVKARSGAQVSDKEINRYEVQFPNYRALFNEQGMKPGGQAMLQGLIENGDAMIRSRIPAKNQDQASQIYRQKLAHRGYGVAADFNSIPDPEVVLKTGRYKQPRGMERPEDIRARASELFDKFTGENPNMTEDELVAAILEELGK